MPVRVEIPLGAQRTSFSIFRERGQQVGVAKRALRHMGIEPTAVPVEKQGEVVGVQLNGQCSFDQFPVITARELMQNKQPGETIQISIPVKREPRI